MFYSPAAISAGESTTLVFDRTFKRFMVKVSASEVRCAVERNSPQGKLLHLPTTYTEIEVPPVNGYSPYKLYIKNQGSATTYLFINIKEFGEEKEPVPNIWL